MKNTIAFLFLTVAMVLPVAVSFAAPATQTPTQRVVERVFSELERATIEEYFGVTAESKKHKHKGKNKKKGGKHGKSGLPPGLAKRDTLPPGLARNDLPFGLQKKLSATRPGTKRVIVGSDVVLMDTATSIVLDVIRDVVRTSTQK